MSGFLRSGFHVWLIAALLCCIGEIASGHPLPLWEVKGERNTVYLLGSIHLLREADYPLPTPVYDAYEDAEQLVMELDMDDLDPARLQALVAALGTVPAGSSLAEVLGREDYAEAERLATAAGLDLDGLAFAKPWLAAITVEQILLQRIGFDPDLGVEAHFLRQATAEGKSIEGLETIDEQLGYLNDLSPAAQRTLLLETLKVAEDINQSMSELVAAWKIGDSDFLEDNLLEDMREQPEIHEAVVVQRNRNWVADIAERLNDRNEVNDYLVIVGTLHLVGEEGVPALLERRGLSVRQLTR